MHLLQQHTYDIQCSSQEFGKEIHSQLSTLLEKTFYPRLEQLFQKYDVPKEHWIIDVLEIKIPEIQKKYWKEELVEKTLSQIEEYLIRYNPKVSKQILETLTEVQNIVPLEKKAMLLVFDFLKTGVLPINSISNKVSDIVEEVVIDEAFVTSLVALFKSDLKCLLRWVFSMPEIFKINVLSFLNNSSQLINFSDIVLKNKPYLKTNDNNTISKFFANTTQIVLWNEFLQWALLLVKKGVNDEDIFLFLNQTFEKHLGVSKEEMYMIVAVAHQNCVLKKRTISSEIYNFLHSWKSQIESVSNLFERIENENNDTNKELHENKREITKASLVENFIYVKNSGLVLLHPFLAMLFEQLNLTLNQEWVSYMAQQKGVLLTHYLVYGEAKVNESQLVLNKILCGLELDEVVNTQIILEVHEKEKCQNLLEAVLEHWSTMQNSSKEALQEAFLQREGKLEIQSSGYEFWIEEKGYDILLEQLPWGIGMIKTPWMQYYLTCHWNQ